MTVHPTHPLKFLKNMLKKTEELSSKKNPKNIGLGLTRNEGIKIASGEYIHCLDSDDWLELDAYEIADFERNYQKYCGYFNRNNIINIRNYRKKRIYRILHY